jgi:phenylpropionate dioxygenase-like ring-hydroxylating dioxygenase large terminal subunit
VVENFAECYHCFPAHPEYYSVMQHVGVLARQGADGLVRRYLHELSVCCNNPRA